MILIVIFFYVMLLREYLNRCSWSFVWGRVWEIFWCLFRVTFVGIVLGALFLSSMFGLCFCITFAGEIFQVVFLGAFLLEVFVFFLLFCGVFSFFGLGGCAVPRYCR